MSFPASVHSPTAVAVSPSNSGNYVGIIFTGTVSDIYDKDNSQQYAWSIGPTQSFAEMGTGFWYATASTFSTLPSNVPCTIHANVGIMIQKNPAGGATDNSGKIYLQFFYNNVEQTLVGSNLLLSWGTGSGHSINQIEYPSVRRFSMSALTTSTGPINSDLLRAGTAGVVKVTMQVNPWTVSGNVSHQFHIYEIWAQEYGQSATIRLV